jgi:hypothetical protein
LPRWVFWIVGIGFMFRSVHFMAEDVCHNEFLYKPGLKDVSKTIQRGNFLRLSYEADDLVDVVH